MRPGGRLASRVGAGLAVITGVWLCVTTSEATAATNPSSVESGWWDMVAPSPVAVPSPTTSKQLQVGEGVNGPLSYAAVRFQLPANIDPSAVTVTLKLNLAQTGTVGTPVVAACVTTGPWTPGGDQPSSAAPGYDCSGGKDSAGIRNGSSESWSISSAFIAAGERRTYDIALVPAPGTNTPFSVDYANPGTSSVLIASSPPVPATMTPNTGLVGQPSPGGAQTAAPPAGLEPNTSPPSGFAVLPVGSSAVPSGNPATPALAAGPPTPAAVGAPGKLPAGSRSGAAALASKGVPARRVMAIVVLLALGAALYLISSRPARPPKLIGAFASKTPAAPALRMGGIGRFAKPRTGQPTRLS